MRVTFKVTAEDQRLGTPRSASCCAIARAATVRLPSGLTVRINDFTAEFWKAVPRPPGTSQRWKVGEISLPEDLRAAVRAIDAGQVLPEFESSLEFPDHFAK